MKQILHTADANVLKQLNMPLSLFIKPCSISKFVDFISILSIDLAVTLCFLLLLLLLLFTPIAIAATTNSSKRTAQAGTSAA